MWLPIVLANAKPPMNSLHSGKPKPCGVRVAVPPPRSAIAYSSSHVTITRSTSEAAGANCGAAASWA
eukprot:scaffold7935_cov417-Prasinococcus_capsulatus_cf.AAC.7